MSTGSHVPDANTSGLFRVAPLALLVGLAACEPAPEQQAAEEPAVPAATPAPQQTPGAEPQPGAPAAPGAQQMVQIRVTEDTVEVSPVDLQGGSTAFQVTNETSVPYDVDIDGPGPDGEAEGLQPGETRTIQMNLQSGSYEIEVEAEQGEEREWESRIQVQG